MKFGESLSEGLVPEWENQYVDYKSGKKLIRRYAMLQQEFERDNVVDTTPLLEPIREGEEQADYFTLNKDVQNDRDAQSKSARTTGSAHPEGSSNLIRRSSIFQFSSFRSRSLRKEDVAEEGAKFNKWLEDELKMVNNFYIDKERDIYHRFLILEDQFAQLKEHRVEIARLTKSDDSSQTINDTRGPVNKNFSRLTSTLQKWLEPLSKHELPSLPSTVFLDKFKSQKRQADDVVLRSSRAFEEFDPNYAENRVRNGKTDYDSGTESDSLESLDSNGNKGQGGVAMSNSNSELFRMSRKRDFERKKQFDVPYLYAKKVLKDALVEHYRSVALVRSYRTMNQTALRKITKKFDKASGSSISGDFMRKVNSSYFQTSLVLEQIQGRVEDLYLSFYGNINDTKKHGLEKLKSATYTMQPRLYHGATFVSGIFLGFAIPLIGIVIYKFVEQIGQEHRDTQKYLGQIWGGFLLVNFAFLLVGVNYFSYTAYKINYKFIFEFDLATVLDYRQFIVLPSAVLGIMGFCSWFSLTNFWPNKFPGKDWPLVFLAIALIVFLWPGRQLYSSGRRWIRVALWRLLWSGFYPVEFRDFYLGDILCSLTYSLSNLSFFICVYGFKWRSSLGSGPIPDTTRFCGSRYSRSMGFLSALPSIWRFLQCLRRYMDTGDMFPHLANMMKYFSGCLYYCFLSLWRIEETNTYRALFITFATVYSTFASTWDIVMDWSLLQPNSKHFLLRDELFYGRPIYYYCAMISDVCLRFLWLVYFAFPGQLQQLALTSFLLAVAELFRRFVWMFFRMENEHRTNVTLFRASRELPLPYHLSRRVENAINRLVDIRYKEVEDVIDISELQKTAKPSRHNIFTKYPEPERPDSARSRMTANSELGVDWPGPVRRSTMGTLSAAFNKAHIKDFQRRKYSAKGVDSDDEDLDEDIKPLRTR